MIFSRVGQRPKICDGWEHTDAPWRVLGPFIRVAVIHEQLALILFWRPATVAPENSTQGYLPAGLYGEHIDRFNESTLIVETDTPTLADWEQAQGILLGQRH